jgi:hypothetical protein
MGISPWLSWVLPAKTPTRTGSPAVSDRMCSLEPGFPRSTGLGPVCCPVTFFVVPEIGAAGLQARHDWSPLSVMIEKVVSPGLVVLVDH